ncbi:MAG: right-handed parallel beta-helix repeat-containing protein, partial [Armatimonadetes bacterium]|nr:right-handed parallel beta-helix repeat-containing protein [Armatimonadota bacterium]
FTSVRDEALLQRVISPEARPRLLQADLRAHGLTDYGELSRHGFHKANTGKTPPLELYLGGRRLTRARWPNPDEALPQFLKGYQKERRGVVGRSGIVDKGPTGDDPDFMARGGTFSVAFDRLALWTQADDIWLDGVFAWSWEWSYNQIAKLDVAQKQITLRYGEMSGLTDQYSSDYFFAENLLEEIDQPGEYYLDRKNGVLYLLPPADFATAEIAVPVLTQPMVALTGVSHVVFRNLHFDLSRGAGLTCSGGAGVLVEQCEFSRFSGAAVSLNGQGHGVRACHLHDVGGVGVGLSGGNLDTLEPSGCFVEDCDIRDFAWYSKVYTPAVSLGYRSVGSRVSHNRISHGPHLAIVVYGNDHLIECNDIGHVVEDFTDMGAIYANLGQWPLERGTVIRRNYFHDLGQHHHLQNAVYPDNQTMGWLIEENVFARIGGKGQAANCRAVNLNTTSHIITRHNLFVDCTMPLLMGTYCAPMVERSKQQWEAYFQQRDLSKLPHAQKYPELLKFWEEPRQYPDTNVFVGNVIYNPTVPLLKQYGKIAMTDGAIIEAGGSLQQRDNWVTETDPGFVDAAAGNYALRPDAAVFVRVPGFPAIPWAEIGPRVTPGPR